MFRSRTFRLLLVLLLVGGISVILVNLWFRSERVPGISGLADLLTSEVSRRSTDFEYSQLKGGRVLFTVKAGVSTTTRSDEHILQDVHLVRLDDEGAETDSIDAASAVYRIDDKQLEFQDDVVIELAQGTRIYADRADADLDREVVTIGESFRFEQGTMEGSGKGMVYEIVPRRLTVRSGLDLSFRTAEQQGSSSSREAVYDLEEGIVRLKESAEVDLGGYRLSASQIALKIIEQSRLERLSAVGSAELGLGTARGFSGNRIEMVVPAEPGSRGDLVVFGDAERAVGTPARYSEQTESGQNELTADRIDAPYLQQVSGSSTALVLTTLAGNGRAGFRSGEAGLSKGTADRFRADFSEEEGWISRLQLEDDVYLRRETDSLEAGTQLSDELWCRRLDLIMERSGAPSRALAEGPVRIVRSGGEDQQELAAGGQATVLYENGMPSEVQADGGCRIVSGREGERGSLTAPRIRLQFEKGRPAEGRAEGGILLNLTGSEETAVARSKMLFGSFKDGVLATARFAGDFRFERTDPDGTLRVEGDQGVYDLPSSGLTVTGAERPELVLNSASAGSTFRTRASRLTINRRQGEITALKQVESTSETGSGATVITADRMTLSSETGWIRYTGEPRMIQQENLVTAEEIRVNRAGGGLEAEGAVDSTLVDRGESGVRQFRVRSDRMRIVGSENRAVYEGDVLLEGEELALRAPRLEAYFAGTDSEGLERIEASGGVDIREQGRHWTTEKAVYYRSTDRVVAAR